MSLKDKIWIAIIAGAALVAGAILFFMIVDFVCDLFDKVTALL